MHAGGGIGVFKLMQSLPAVIALKKNHVHASGVIGVFKLMRSAPAIIALDKTNVHADGVIGVFKLMRSVPARKQRSTSPSSFSKNLPPKHASSSATTI